MSIEPIITIQAMQTCITECERLETSVQSTIEDLAQEVLSLKQTRSSQMTGQISTETLLTKLQEAKKLQAPLERICDVHRKAQEQARRGPKITPVRNALAEQAPKAQELHEKLSKQISALEGLLEKSEQPMEEDQPPAAHTFSTEAPMETDAPIQELAHQVFGESHKESMLDTWIPQIRQSLENFPKIDSNIQTIKEALDAKAKLIHFIRANLPQNESDKKNALQEDIQRLLSFMQDFALIKRLPFQYSAPPQPSADQGPELVLPEVPSFQPDSLQELVQKPANAPVLGNPFFNQVATQALRWAQPMATPILTIDALKVLSQASGATGVTSTIFRAAGALSETTLLQALPAIALAKMARGWSWKERAAALAAGVGTSIVGAPLGATLLAALAIGSSAKPIANTARKAIDVSKPFLRRVTHETTKRTGHALTKGRERGSRAIRMLSQKLLESAQ